MSTTRIPNETPEQRTERLAIARQNAAFWEDVLRSLPMVPDAPASKPATLPTTSPEAP